MNTIARYHELLAQHNLFHVTFGIASEQSESAADLLWKQTIREQYERDYHLLRLKYAHDSVTLPHEPMPQAKESFLYTHSSIRDPFMLMDRIAFFQEYVKKHRFDRHDCQQVTRVKRIKGIRYPLPAMIEKSIN